MTITFRKFTASARLSEETTAYDTQVLFEGKPIGTCRNEGRGGLGHFRPHPGVDPERVDRAQAWASAQPVIEENGQQMVLSGKPIFFDGIEDYCDSLADETLAHKQVSAQVKRLLKTHILFINPDDTPGVLQAKQVWRPELEAALRKRHPNAIILNAMPVDEAITAFRDEQARQLAHESGQPKPRGMRP